MLESVLCKLVTKPCLPVFMSCLLLDLNVCFKNLERGVNTRTEMDRSGTPGFRHAS